VKVRLGSPLRSYTGGVTTVDADGDTLDELLVDLDRRYPGLRFRIVDEQAQLRQHVTVWIRSERCRDLATPLAGLDEVVIMQALSGG
jgi:molybdopterin converting factor small subunit